MKSLVRKVLSRLPAGLRLPLETALLLVQQRYLFRLKARRPALPPTLAREALDELLHRVSTEGFAVIPDFKTADWCERAVRETLEALGSSDRVTRHQEDSRVFGIEKLSSSARELASDPMLKAAACGYAGSHEELMFCMANRVEHRPGVSHGSGGEWHRDSFKCELKAMLYLTDVREEDGAFAIVRKSHRLGTIVLDVLRLVLGRERGTLRSFSSTRLGDAGTYLNRRGPGRVVALTAKRGTLLLFDGSAIHTGLPPQPGGVPRLALTNYYCAQSDLPAALAYYQRYVKLN